MLKKLIKIFLKTDNLLKTCIHVKKVNKNFFKNNLFK